MNLNTEIGLIIVSPELSRQVTARFDAIASPANSFVVALDERNGSRSLIWQSLKDGKPITYNEEPGDDRWREFIVDLYATLPIEDQL
jgi:putative cardiolipin synthase